MAPLKNYVFRFEFLAVLLDCQNKLRFFEICTIYVFCNAGYEFLGALAKLRKAVLARHICTSAWNSSTPTGRIFMKLGI
jgi:hypothetical protein